MIPRLHHVEVFTEQHVSHVQSLATELYGFASIDVNGQAHNPRRDLLFKFLARHHQQNREKIDGASLRNLLLFRYDAIGDYIVSSPILRWLKAAVPECAIDVISSYRNHAIVSSDPFVRSAIPINPVHGFRPSWFRVRQQSRAVPYDAVLAVVFTRMSKAGILTSMVSGHPRTVTVRHHDRAHIYGRLFDLQVPHRLPEHWAVTMQRIVLDTIVPVERAPQESLRPYISIQASAAERVVNFCAERSIRWNSPPSRDVLVPSGSLPPTTAGAPYILVNVAAYSPNRNWSAEDCSAALELVSEALPGHELVVTCPPGVDDIIHRIQANWRRAKPLHVWRGGLPELFAVVAGASMVITPDTALVHIAAAAEVPCVVLFAELIKVAEWYPYGVPFRAVLSNDPESLAAIPAATIADAAADLWRQGTVHG